MPGLPAGVPKVSTGLPSRETAADPTTGVARDAGTITGGAGKEPQAARIAGVSTKTPMAAPGVATPEGVEVPAGVMGAVDTGVSVGVGPRAVPTRTSRSTGEGGSEVGVGAGSTGPGTYPPG